MGPHTAKRHEVQRLRGRIHNPMVTVVLSFTRLGALITPSDAPLLVIEFFPGHKSLQTYPMLSGKEQPSLRAQAFVKYQNMLSQLPEAPCSPPPTHPILLCCHQHGGCLGLNGPHLACRGPLSSVSQPCHSRTACGQ